MIKKILKIVFIVFLLAALAAVDAWFVWKKGLSMWVGIAIFAGIVCLFVGFIFIRKYFLRRKEKKFVQRVVQLDESIIKGAPIHERQQLQDLQDHWKESLELLKRSSLRKHGNPLYALPWYVVIGESGSGKTTAIRTSRLASPVDYPDRAATFSATINFDWWFFENSIVLDTAGRYTIPLDEIPDREEWEKFLTLLAKYRRREPINGVIATIAADKLLASDRGTLRGDGQNIRKRIDQLMRVVGARFPVYILVTKMDLVYGFNDIFEDLPMEDVSQAMGYIKRKAKGHWDSFLYEAFESVSERIGDLSFLTVRSKRPLKPGTIMFRDEFLKLKPGLVEFMNAVFGDNPYQETPLLRGIFFSSGRQDGIPSSEFLEVAGFTPEGKKGPVAEKGMFLRDIFAKILPGDRSLYTLTRDFLRWRHITQGLGLISWVLLWVALCGLLTFSFFRNVTILNNFMDVFKKPPALNGDTASDLINLEKYRIEIAALERANAHWFLPSFGLTASKTAEQKAKELYIFFVDTGFLWNFDKITSNKVDTISVDTDPNKIAVYANYLVKRTALVNTMLDSGKPGDIKAFSEAAADAVDHEYPSLPYEASNTFGNIYTDYLRWKNNRVDLLKDRELLQAALVKLLTKHSNMEWLVYKSIPNAPDVSLENFWGSPEVGEHDGSVFVLGAFTKVGQQHIADFIKSIEAVLPGNGAIAKSVIPFWKWYQDEYYKTWYDFVDNFHRGAEAFQTETAKRNMAILMTTDHNPYWKLISRLSDEWVQSDARTKPPNWTRLPTELIKIAQLSPDGTEKDKKEQGFVARIGEKMKKAETSVEQKVSKLDPGMEKIVEQRPSRAKVFGEYAKSLAKIAPISTSGDTALSMVSDLFAGQAALTEDKSPFNMAYVQYLTLKNMMKEDNYGSTDFLWSVFGGPLSYLVEYGTQRASCLLQDKWEGDVVGKIQGVPKENLSKALFDKTEGVVVQFREGPAKPFLVKGRIGYSPRKAYEKTIFEHSIPFRSEFLRFLNAGTTAPVEFQSDYTVTMETLPIEVNRDAPVKPIGNVLSLQCSDGTVILKNYNYPNSGSFRWSPEKCSDTVLKIMFPDFTLARIYKGKTGFANFLSDFSSGGKTYKASDFPEKKMSLSKAGVKWIKVRYRIENAEPVMATLREGPKRAPTIITDCTLR